MLMNNLDPQVAERPEDLIVYGGSGRAARSWAAFDAIVATLRRLEHDETLIVQSGKPVAVFRTHPWAPRVLIANALLVPAWATWDRFRDLEDRGLTMYGQMTAGSWIYIGTQGILQGTYETLAAVGRRHFGGDLRGRLAVTAGLGGMGGAQPLAVTMNGGVALVVEVDPQRIARRLASKYVDEETARPRHGARPRRALAARGHRAVDRPARQCRRCPARTGAPGRDAGHRHRPDVGARRAERLRGSRHVARRSGDPARRQSRRVRPPLAALDGRARRGDARDAAARRGGVRLRQQHPRAGREGGRRPTPSRSRASCPSTSGRCSARARARSAGRRCRAIRRTSPRPTISRSRSSPTTRRSAAGFSWRASGSRSRACRRGSSGSARATAPVSAWR